jgi:hypothetical protein
MVCPLADQRQNNHNRVNNIQIGIQLKFVFRLKNLKKKGGIYGSYLEEIKFMGCCSGQSTMFEKFKFKIKGE